MKIIHCADLHLDSKMETKLTREQAKERRYEILATFEEMVAYAKEHGVRVIMITGDLFDAPQNQQKTIKNRVLDTILRTKEIDFLYLQGNHDRDDFFQSLEELPENLKLFTDEWKHYAYGNLVITGLNFTDDNQASYYDSLSLNEQDANIVMLHGQVTQYGQGGNEGIPLSQFAGRAIDYLALGHIHEYRKERLDERGIYCYSGCLEGRGFDECGTKGFVVLTVEEGTIDTEFVTLSRRVLHEVRLDVSPYATFLELMKALEEEIDPICEDDLVNIRLVGEVLEGFELDVAYIEQFVKRRFYYGQVKDRSEIKIDEAKYQNDRTLKGEFIRKVQSMEVSDEEKKSIIRFGLRALAGKEVLG